MNRLIVEDLAQHTLPLVEATLVDVRESWEFELGHLVGSVHVPLSKLPAYLEEQDPAKKYIFVCHHGIRSARATAFAESLGYVDVWNLSGGVAAWSEKVDPSFPRY